MTTTRSPDLRRSSRELHRLLEFVSRELPSSIAGRFDPGVENVAVGTLGLALFVERHWREFSPHERSTMREWLKHSSAPCAKELLEWAITLVESPTAQGLLRRANAGRLSDPRDVLEQVLVKFDPSRRRRLGFYCTPVPLADFVVERVHRLLVAPFKIRGGLPGSRSTAGTEARDRLQILDPAVGTGVFPAAIVRAASRQWVGESGVAIGDRRWSAVVASQLLPRLHACDIQLAPVACAHVRLASTLLSCGFDFGHQVPLSFWQGNPLAHCDVGCSKVELDGAPRAATDFVEFLRTPFALIIGNPPYGAIHAPVSAKMRRLMRGQLGTEGGGVDYFESADGPLAERKTWLYDHYIQFIRWAQFRIEQLGWGIVAFLTNRGLLRHVTLRGLRYQWLQAFDRIEIHDFHGGENRSTTDYELVEDNVFGVRSGIALSLLARFEQRERRSCRVRMQVHEGNAAEKLRRLSDSRDSLSVPQPLIPQAPLYQFRPGIRQRRTRAAELRLDDCFERHSSAIVTARDSLVIGFDRDDLLGRIGLLRDRTITDEELRKRLFPKSRSSKYPRGDTRSWKLTEAREAISGNLPWESYVQRCSYRPLDDRLVYWHPRMIDWPRTAVSELMRDGGNVVLIARRQTADDSDSHFYWITRWPTIDGILRSDNRGNESVFPVLQSRDPGVNNLSGKLMELAERRLRSTIETDSRNPWEALREPFSQNEKVGSHQLFAYLVATVFSPSFRASRQSAAEHDFIPVDITDNPIIFRRLAESGRKLIRTIGDVGGSDPLDSQPFSAPEHPTISKPTWSEETVRAGTLRFADNVPEAVWSFRAGSHQVCRKWLSDRAGRALTLEIQAEYELRIRAIRRILSEVQEVESVVAEYGGWDAVLR